MYRVGKEEAEAVSRVILGGSYFKVNNIYGETEKADKYANGILRYGVTPEFMVSERYSSVDPWFTPWQPNASGAGRLDHFLLNYYGERKVDDAE